MRDSREEGDDYAEGYAVGQTHQRTDIRRVELVKKERKKERNLPPAHDVIACVITT